MDKGLVIRLFVFFVLLLFLLLRLFGTEVQKERFQTYMIYYMTTFFGSLFDLLLYIYFHYFY